MLPTETSTATATEAPTVETTSEPTPPAEVTVEVTVEITPELTAETTAEAPTSTPTASETPLPPEPNWLLLSSGDFEQGTAPSGWLFDNSWGPQVANGNRALGPRSFGGSALFVQSALHDAVIQLSVRLGNGIFAFGVRQSEAGGYTATFEESGFLRLYRNGQEVGQMFLGPIAGQWRTLRLSAAGNVVRVFLDGAELITFVDDAPLPAGQVTLGGRRSRESRFAVDDLSLWAAEAEAGTPAAFAAPLALAAPMVFGSESAPAAGRIPSTLAWSDAFGYDSNDLTLAAPDGTLSAFPGLELAARQPWSPDGQWLLVRMNGDDGLGILNPLTGETRMLTTLPALDDGTRDECPAWSPDGTQVVFLSRRRDGPVPVGGGWTWYPPALYGVGVDGQTAPSRIALSTDPDGLVLGCPQWSAVGNGQQVVSLAYQDIYAVDALTGSIVTLYHDDYLLANKLQDPFTLSPDGTRVAFGQIVAAIDVPSNVSVLDLQTGAVLTAAEEKISEGDSSYFGHWALYTSWDWDNTGTRLVISRDRMVENPTGFGWAYSRDIVISDLAQPCPACAITSVPNSQRTVYVETVIPYSAGVTWSPDGRWIAAVDTLPWDPGTGGDALAQLVLLDLVCAERLTVTEPQVWTNSYDGWGGFALVAWQPLPAGSGGMMAFGVGDEYCHVPTETPEPTPDPLGPGCPAVINLQQDRPTINFREAPNTGATILAQLTDGTAITLFGLNRTGDWAYIEWSQIRGWMSRDAVIFAACATYSVLEDDATPIAGAPYDFIVDVRNTASFRTSLCLRSLPEDATEDERNANYRGCARVVLYYFSTQFSSESPMRMSDILSAVYSGELSTLVAATGSVPLGLNSFSSISADDIGREALINNFWAVAYQLRRTCLESEGCDFALSPEEIADTYLYQVQSWYQRAIPFQHDEVSGNLLNTYFATSRAYRGLAYEALLSADRTIEGRPWQWGNYGYGNPSYDQVHNNSATAYCYMYRAFVGDPQDGVQFVKGTEYWTDYKFAIITVRSIGETSTFDIQDGTNRPAWLDGVIMVPQSNGNPVAMSYVQYLINHNGRVYAPCNISASEVFPTRG